YGRGVPVFGVAQVDAGQVVGDFALDGGEVIGVPLGGLRSPRTGPVRVVVVFGQRRQEFTDDLDVHWSALRPGDDEADRGRGATAEVQCPKGFRVLPLVVAGRSTDLLGRIDQHAHPGRADRMSAADQPAAGVDRQ